MSIKFLRKAKLPSKYFTFCDLAFCPFYQKHLASLPFWLNSSHSTFFLSLIWGHFTLLPQSLEWMALSYHGSSHPKSLPRPPTTAKVAFYPLPSSQLLATRYFICFPTLKPNKTIHLCGIRFFTVWTLWRNKHETVFFLSDHYFQLHTIQFSSLAS